MHVTVDRGACQDHGQCAIAAPLTFRISEAGELDYDEFPGESQRIEVTDAADVCPAQAIRIHD